MIQASGRHGRAMEKTEEGRKMEKGGPAEFTMAAEILYFPFH